jgi:hypothetical protein
VGLDKRAKMDTNKTTARTVGALFLISNVTFILGALVLVESILGVPDYLTLVSANRNQVISGVLLELINGLAYVGIALLMFPILRQRFESLALGYVGFRIIEFIMQIASDLSPLSLLNVSEEFVKAGAPQSSSFQALGTLMLAERFWAFQMLSLVFGLGALMFYYMLYQTRLIPRFISVWGLIGALLVLATAVLGMFGVSLSSGIEVVLGLPMLLNELFLGIWLIVRGFNSSATVLPDARQI